MFVILSKIRKFEQIFLYFEQNIRNYKKMFAIFNKSSYYFESNVRIILNKIFGIMNEMFVI